MKSAEKFIAIWVDPHGWMRPTIRLGCSMIGMLVMPG
jgi:hypothetical protein